MVYRVLPFVSCHALGLTTSGGNFGFLGPNTFNLGENVMLLTQLNGSIGRQDQVSVRSCSRTMPCLVKQQFDVKKKVLGSRTLDDPANLKLTKTELEAWNSIRNFHVFSNDQLPDAKGNFAGVRICDDDGIHPGGDCDCEIENIGTSTLTSLQVKTDDAMAGVQCTVKQLGWPASLEKLRFSNDFNESLEKVTLPSGLKELTFGFEFNQPLEKVVLPNTLEKLTFGMAFHQSLKNATLPDSLQVVWLPLLYNQSLEKVKFPNGLKPFFRSIFEPEVKFDTSGFV